MPTIMCTQDLWRRLGHKGRPPARSESDEPGTHLGAWSAKVIDEPQGIFCLALNERTYLTIVFAFVEPLWFFRTFASAVAVELEHLGFSEPLILSETGPLFVHGVLAKNTNRSLLGSLNDVAFHLAWELERAGHADPDTLAEIQHDLNMMPHANRDPSLPAEAAVLLLAEEASPRAA
jgi:hypothetical protein